jgi:hypothetical protein
VLAHHHLVHGAVDLQHGVDHALLLDGADHLDGVERIRLQQFLAALGIGLEPLAPLAPPAWPVRPAACWD